jgi:hypothetical protein
MGAECSHILDLVYGVLLARSLWIQRGLCFAQLLNYTELSLQMFSITCRHSAQSDKILSIILGANIPI